MRGHSKVGNYPEIENLGSTIMIATRHNPCDIFFKTGAGKGKTAGQSLAAKVKIKEIASTTDTPYASSHRRHSHPLDPSGSSSGFPGRRNAHDRNRVGYRSSGAYGNQRHSTRKRPPAPGGGWPLFHS